MSDAEVVFLALQAIVFLAWTALAFRMLFHLRARSEARTGRIWTGPEAFVAVTRDWLADPTARPARRWLGGLALALFALMAVRALTLTR